MVDFAELKSRVTIKDAADYLGLTLLKSGADQARGPCPVCKPEDKRILVVTPSKNVAYCHHLKKGGDCIWLVAHIRNVGMYQAANELAQRFPGSEPATPPQEHQKPEPTGSKFDAEKYFADLNPHAPELEPMGLDLDLVAECGGLAAKGVLRGHLALALRKRDGETICYMGVDPATGIAKFVKPFKKS